jgi:ADP-ribose pyrophosphatase YjhB (NUDIX family)
VVLVKRRHPPLQGEWSLPGGAIELGETIGDAVRREVREETGLVVEIVDVAGVFDRIQRSADGRAEYHYVIIDYVCRRRAGRLACGSDAADVRWVRFSDLPRYRLTKTARAFIRRAIGLLTASDATGNTPARRAAR